jgi:integrase
MAAMATPWKHPNSGIYYLRLEVPISLRHIIGKREIKKSLRTTSFSAAKTLFAQKYAEAQQLFSAARQAHTYTIKDVDVLAHRWLVQTTDNFQTEEDLNLWLLKYSEESRYRGREEVAEPDIEKYVEALASSYETQFSVVGESVNKLMLDNAVFLEKGGKLHSRLVERMVRMHVEASKIAHKRHLGDWSRLSRSIHENAQQGISDLPESNLTTDSSTVRADTGKTLDGTIAQFSSYKIECSGWDEKTQRDAEIVFDLLRSYTGIQVDIDAISREQLRAFYSLLHQLPANYSKRRAYKGKGLLAVLRVAKSEHCKPIAAATAKKKMLFVKSLFKFAYQEEWVTKNRAEGLKNPRTNDSKKREALTCSDIKLIFDATAVASRASDYWLPRISLSTGMRANEILQLTAQDVKTVKGIHYININDEVDTDTGKPKKVKRSNSLRKVPVPNVLIASGFIDFVNQCTSNRLFPCVKIGKSGTYTQQYSKRINTLLFKLGVKPPSDSNVKKDFHSFRHTFRAHARQAGISKEMADLIGGWSDQSSASEGDNYGRTFDLFMDQLKAEIDKIDYSGLDF